jgi:hypothetical protein
MKKIYLKSIIFIGFLFVIGSCSDDWLKPDPLSFFAPEKIFVDEAGYESALIQCRKEMNGDNHGEGQWHFISLEFMYSDLACSIRQSDFSQNTPSLARDRSALLNLFTRSYSFIKNANTIISRIDDITWADERVRNRILGEALWFRAYWYYRLVNAYGDIPWIDQEVRSAKIDYYSTSRWAILGRLQKDLEFAAAYLPVTAAAKGNISKGAANHLLTKVYLANCEFDKAIASATDVINGPYELMTKRFGNEKDKGPGYYNMMWDLHRVQNKNLPENTETIYATVDRADQSPDTWWRDGNTGTGNAQTYSMRHFSPAYWRVPDSRGQRACNWSTASGDTLGQGDAAVRTNNYFHYTIWEDGVYNYSTTPDLRRTKGNWIEMGAEICDQITATGPDPNTLSVDFGQPLKRSNITSLNDTIEWWYPWPYYKTFVPRTPPSSNPYGGVGDWYIFRLAETYLLRAEAYWWKGQTGPAADDINKVRQRAQALPITSSDVDIEYIFDERARELYMEESRHSEMVRVSYMFAKLNREGYSLENIISKNWYYDRTKRVNHFYSPPIFTYLNNTARLDPHNMLWPIPQSVITANTQGRINQNIGYQGDDLRVPPLETIP